VLQALCTRVIRRVRALVVLPTHDLAQQVADVMRMVCSAVQLDVGVVAGKGSLRPEADALVRLTSLLSIPTQACEPSLSL
jgi:ATP-dependent RNA helicase DDX51/DBP6